MKKDLHEQLYNTLLKLFIKYQELRNYNLYQLSNEIKTDNKEVDDIVICNVYNIVYYTDFNQNLIFDDDGEDNGFAFHKSKRIFLKDVPQFYFDAKSGSGIINSTHNNVILGQYQIKFIDDNRGQRIDVCFPLSSEILIETIETMKQFILKLQHKINVASDTIKDCKGFLDMSYEKYLLIEKINHS